MTRSRLIARVDNWWISKSSSRRMDRAPGNVAMTLGLLFPSFSIILKGPSPSSFLSYMPTMTQIAMCAMIFIGLMLCLHGIMSGSRWYFPKSTVSASYRKALYGVPLAFTGLMVYTFFLAEGTKDVWGIFGFLLTPMLGFGLLGQMLLYWLDIRRIRANTVTLTESAKVRARIINELSGDS